MSFRSFGKAGARPADCECHSRFSCKACFERRGPTVYSVPPVCIRCGAPNGRDASKDDVRAPDYVPFQHRYCAPCVMIRRAERARADIVQGPIVEARA